jgi:hypothetical protein
MHAIGIDMSKASFHAALDDDSVRTFKNTKEGIALFLKSIGDLLQAQETTTIGVESTGVYHLLFCTTVRGAGYPVVLINPLASHCFIAAKTLRQLKTDVVDARAVRSMVQAGLGRLFVETEQILALKTLVTQREGLVTIRAAMKHQREARRVRNSAIAQTLYDPAPALMAKLETEIRKLESQFLGYEPAPSAFCEPSPASERFQQLCLSRTSVTFDDSPLPKVLLPTSVSTAVSIRVARRSTERASSASEAIAICAPSSTMPPS